MFILLQKLIPQHALSRLVGKLAYWQAGFLKDLFIGFFVRHYGVNVQEIENFDPKNYACFNDFFTRYLKAGARPIAQAANAVVSPADGAVSELGDSKAGRILQAKQHDYSIADLLGGDAVSAAQFADGKFATIYLAPKDYHRLHMPLAGQLLQMVHVPGKLFSVNQQTVAAIPNLFARNERVVCIFKTAVGPMAVILVGATCVGSIEMKWHGVVTPATGRKLQHWEYYSQNIKLERGEEIAHFNMGSTVIVLFAKDAMQWDARLQAGSVVKMGEEIGVVK